MRTSYFLTLGLFFIACSSSNDPSNPKEGDNPGGAGGGGTTSSPAGASSGLGGAGDRGEIGTPVQIAPGQATMVGTTSDGWVVFRAGDVLRAAKVADPSTVQEVTDRPGSVLIRGRVVFNWADVNWEEGVGDLSIWSADSGAHEVGPTPFAEALVGASADGKSLVFTANRRELGTGGAAAEAGDGSGGEGAVPEKVTDLVIAAADLSTQSVLIEGMGLGSESTCSPSIGFVGERLLVGWCPPGSRAAKIERYEQSGDEWEPTTIAEDALPNWSTDAAGDAVFYQSSGYSGYVALPDGPVLIDAGVSSGTLLPDGSSVLYTVGDQLRRTELPSVNPVAIVTTGYKQPVGFSPDFGLALYSTTVTYERGTQRDLLLTETSAFNADPLVLVSKPVATLTRSSMTRDGKYVFWLTDVTPSGGTLHVSDAQGDEVIVLPKVVDAVAGEGSMLVFTDNSSDPEQYPVVADLKVLDLKLEDEPRIVEEKILDAKAFQVDKTGTVVSYVRSGVERDSEAPERDGVFSVTIR